MTAPCCPKCRSENVRDVLFRKRIALSMAGLSGGMGVFALGPILFAWSALAEARGWPLSGLGLWPLALCAVGPLLVAGASMLTVRETVCDDCGARTR